MSDTSSSTNGTTEEYHEGHEKEKPDGYQLVRAHNYIRPWSHKDQASAEEKDIVLRIICKTIADLSKKDINAAGHNYWVCPLKPSSPLSEPCLENDGVKRYILTAEYNAGQITGYYSDSCNIEVRNEHGWVPLTQWLLEHEREKQLKGDMGIKAQQIWWKNTGKHFPLMALPAELRALIFQQTLGGNIYPSYFYTRIGIETDMDNMVDPGSSPHCPNPDILLASKQVYKEAREAVWEGTTKHFCFDSHFEEVLSYPSLWPTYNWLTSVQLSFPLDEYFTFFGIEIGPTLQFQPNGGPAEPVKSLHSLREIELYFAPLTRLKNNPWLEYRREYGSQSWFYNAPKYRDMSVHPCMKAVVDYVALGAFPYLRHIPRVNLIGAVKSSIKKKWRQIYDQAYANKNYGYEVVGFDYDEEVAKLSTRMAYE
ncbi:uncharacterized protein N0V89_000032 [Didymosphaeria variabile]|uniref:Uncharacterized protein n=1 Tax=Didymosphaeria variabile TaxID=1932322 RepID=A0A9W9CEK0_9PLEO|nr:uncharacterized protein N0V89_000032 [Didymosphaeria variabile]KAJ4359478.1 hypothetical protein N0V89_000032 [Didymosphaeria variabile]